MNRVLFFVEQIWLNCCLPMVFGCACNFFSAKAYAGISFLS